MKDNKEDFFKADQFNSFADTEEFKGLSFEDLENVAGGVLLRSEMSDQEDRKIQSEKEAAAGPIKGPFFG